MTPAEQMDIIKSFEELESMDDEGVSKRDLEVSHNQSGRVSGANPIVTRNLE